MPRLIPCLLAVAAPVLLVACAGLGQNACRESQSYQAAQSVPPLRVPEGFAAPATRNALRIPDLPGPVAERAADAPCLDKPPSFDPGRPKTGRTGLAG